MIDHRLNANTNRFVRFLVAGGLNTLVGFAVYSICIVTGNPAWLALLIGMIFGIVFNFFTAGGYVFRELLFYRFPRFVCCYLVIYAINLLSVELISIWLSSQILAQAIIILPLAMLSYILQTRFVFSKAINSS